MQEEVVLHGDLERVAAEVERGGGHLPAQIIHIEDQILVEDLALAENHPSQPRRRQPILMARGIDR
ncbi:hypothetical protein D3C81_1196330 [compost metagenome]